ncbi:MAG: cytochrome c biogenesis protein ResB [Rubrivivax sp.]|nr:cytochrome c biogenesis protein ResB [Rubrivivax sp.]
MAVSTSGVEVAVGSRRVRDAIELLSSMRFSISLLTVICIASVIGTVVKQNEPLNNYVNQFGPFWADVFGRVNLYTVYSAPWFLLILAFLVLSTSLCIARNLPKIIADWQQYKEGLREQSLQAFAHKGQAVVAEAPAAALQRVSDLLIAQGWRAKVQTRDHGVMLAARKGRSNKIGYLAAHSSIVLICVGGLLDGDLVVKAQMALLGKSTFAGGGLIAEVPPEHRLSVNNPTFRGNLFVPEGARAGVAVLNMPDGVVLQDLPFDVELKKFVVEYYATGMPKLFASEIVIHDRKTGSKAEHRVEVNKPAFHDGVAIYQSSFDDGGSRVKLRGLPLGLGKPFEIEGNIGGKTELVSNGPRGEEKVTLEFATLRLINVENMGGGVGARGAAGDSSGADVRKVDLVNSIESRLGAGHKAAKEKVLQNVGPSITYRLRDAAGQAREYQNYMAPVPLEGSSVFLIGVRDNPQDSFRYLRVPADENSQIDGWLRLRQALDDPGLRDQAAHRYVAIAAPADKPELVEQLTATTRRALGLFAGAEKGKAPNTLTQTLSGLQALADFMETSVPEGERLRVSEVLLRILNGSLFELLNLTREQAGLQPLKPGPEAERFMTQAVTSLSDSYFYPAPLIFQLSDFTQVQASVFQVARAPGKTLVYLGCGALILGIFMMLYVRDRRLWVWLQAAPGTSDGVTTRISTALSSTRRTLDGDAEFDRLKSALLKEHTA